MLAQDHKQRILSQVGIMVRFIVCGACSAALYIEATRILQNWTNLPTQVAASISFACVVVISYFSHYHWTFRSMRPHSDALPRFVGVNVIGLTLNYAVISLTLRYSPLSTLAALLVGVFVVVIWNYSLSRSWVFG